MKIIERWDFIPKEGKPPLFSIADMVKRKEEEKKDDDTYPVKTITIRNKEGLYTKEYHLKQEEIDPERGDHEIHLIAWNTERSIFINASTWGGETFNNFDIRIPSHADYHYLPYSSWCSEYTELSMDNKINLSKIFEITEMDKYMKNDKIHASLYSYIHKHTDEYDEKECERREIEDLSKTSAADYFIFY